MPGKHSPPTVETVPPTPTFPAEFPRGQRRTDNTNRKPRSYLSHQVSSSSSSSSSSNSANNHKIGQQDSFTARRMSALGASNGAPSSHAAPRRHSLQAAPLRHRPVLHTESPAEMLGDGVVEDDDEHGTETPDSPTPETLAPTENSAFLLPPHPPRAPDTDQAFVPQPERGRNRKPKPVSPSPPRQDLPRQQTIPEKESAVADDADNMQLVHPKSRWEQDGKQNITSPTTDSSHSGHHSPLSDTSLSHEQGEHETDRSSSPEHTTSYDEEKAKIETQLKAAQAAQARNTALGMGMGIPGDRLSMGVGGGMPAGGMGFGSIIGGGYQYPYALPGQGPPGAQSGSHSHMQPPQSPHFQLEAPPFGQAQMARPSAHYDPSRGNIPPTPMSDPQAYLNPMPQRNSTFPGPPQREYGSGGPNSGGVPGSTPALDPQERNRQYGTPEMPRGNAVLPHIRSGALTPRPNHINPQVKHLPRGERLPLTGYELLATQLANRRRRDSISSTTSGKPGEPNQRHTTLPPVYKRFTALNHRLLLTLQDELSELEGQLHRLDTTDTQIRRVPSGILPASRRQDASTPNELQWTRSNLIARIGEKVGVYNHILSTFQKTQALPAPSSQDVLAYRNYLNDKMPIAENEARFLDAEWDLISLASPPEEGDEWAGSTHASPTSRRSSLVSQRPGSSGSLAGPKGAPSFFASHQQQQQQQRHINGNHKKSVEFRQTSGFPTIVPVLAAAGALAVLLPVLTFLVIPVFVGRMTVVLLVAGGISAGLMQGGLVVLGGNVESTDMMVVAGVYGAVMAVVAGIIG